MQQRVRKPHRGLLLRPPGNALSRRHLTRCFLLCCPYDTRWSAKCKEKMEKYGNHQTKQTVEFFGSLIDEIPSSSYHMKRKREKGENLNGSYCF